MCYDHYGYKETLLLQIHDMMGECQTENDPVKRLECIVKTFDFITGHQVCRGMMYAHPNFENSIRRKLDELERDIPDRVRVWKERVKRSE